MTAVGQMSVFAMKTQALVHVSHKYVILSNAPHMFEVEYDTGETWKTYI